MRKQNEEVSQLTFLFISLISSYFPSWGQRLFSNLRHRRFNFAKDMTSNLHVISKIFNVKEILLDSIPING